MVSAWMDSNGPLTLNQEQWNSMKAVYPGLPKKALFTLKFGKEWGYYDYPKFEKDLTWALRIATILYPTKKIVFLFDNSSVHRKKGVDALDASKMNLNPGGKQPIFRTTIFEEHEQSFIFPLDHLEYPGMAKGARQIALERNLDIEGMKRQEIIDLLASCDDFKNETSLAEKLCSTFGVEFMLIPKFHCEFNWCELVWANSKKFVRKNEPFNLPSLEKLIPLSFAAIQPETYLKIYQHAIEEIIVTDIDGDRKSLKKVYKSHRPVAGNLPHSHLVS